MEAHRYCKKCLTRDIIDKDEYFARLQEMIEEVEPELRTPSDEYESRLLVCKECERLADGMCRACGCYVELRANIKTNSCPYELW